MFVKCSKPYCSNEAVAGLKLCQPCRTRQKEIAKKCYNNKRIKGICAFCSNKTEDGLSICGECKSKNREYIENNKKSKPYQIYIIKDMLNYNSDTGIFTWKVNTKNYKIGDIAGKLTENGYLCINIKGQKYLAHRVAWFFIYGEFPENLIDHINGIKTDNRIENLREATYITNGQNMKKAMVNNKLGVLGVCVLNGYITARIQVNKKVVNLGNFKTVKEAQEAYLKAKRELHEFNTL